MSTPLAPGMYVRATHVVQGLNGQVALPSMHYKILSITGAPTDIDVATAFDGIGGSELIPMMSLLVTYKGALAQIIAPLPVKAKVSFTSSTGPGTGGTTLQPQQVCGLASFTTALAGRSQRGRYYVPFPWSGAIATGGEGPSAAYITLGNNLAIALGGLNSVGAGANTATVVAVVYHSDFLSGDPITNRSFRAKWATQRRRGDYGRQNVSPI
jgi:hypothetical protein